MNLRLLLTSSAGTKDISQLAPAITWSGDYTQCARTLDFGLLSSPTDPHIPVIDCSLGTGVTLALDDVELFSGFIVSRTKSTESSVIDITAFDRGFYVKRNKASYQFKGAAPEDITRRICADFGIETGYIAQTGVKISRSFVATTLYHIIQTAYTLASRETGEKYLVRFEGAKLSVVKVGAAGAVALIAGESNLMSASTTESIENMINQVQIVSKEGTVRDTVRDESLIRLYGLLQEQIRSVDGENMRAQAKRLLENNGVSQRITVHNLGDVRCVTGNAVAVEEPYTGLFGLFYIESDTHTWKNGQYYNKLVLNYRRMMDEKEAGSVISAAKKKASGQSGSPWQYLYKPGEG